MERFTQVKANRDSNVKIICHECGNIHKEVDMWADLHVKWKWVCKECFIEINNQES